MGSLAIVEGEPVFLRLQLHDYATDRVVKARLYTISGAFLIERTLAHTGGGMYINTAHIMPAYTIISTYIIYESDGVTLSTTHGSAEDTFYIPELDPSTEFNISDVSLAEIRKLINLLRAVDLKVKYEDDVLEVSARDESLSIKMSGEDLTIKVVDDDLIIKVTDETLDAKTSCAESL